MPRLLLRSLLCLLAASALRAATDPDLLVHLTFNAATAQPADDSGHRTKAKLYGRAGYGRGVEGQGICLAKGAYLELANPKPFVRDTQAFSVAFWVKPAAVGKNTRLVQKGAHESEWRIYLNEEGRLTFWVHQKSAGAVRHAAPAVGEWVHLAVTYADLELRMYLNGTRVESRTSGRERVAFSRDPILLGAGWDRDRRPVEPFAGCFDDFRYYGRALAAGEIAALAQR